MNDINDIIMANNGPQQPNLYEFATDSFKELVDCNLYLKKQYEKLANKADTSVKANKRMITAFESKKDALNKL